MYKYILEPYRTRSSRHHCPMCKKQKTFTLYTDVSTNLPLNGRVGRCDREIQCGYHYTPLQYFKDNGINAKYTYTSTILKPQPPISFIDPQSFKRSLAAYSSNNFIIFLHSVFDKAMVENLIAKYFIGSAKCWQGATIFWQVDGEGKIRTGKVMLYHPTSGKRVKEQGKYFNWTHTLLRLRDYNLKQCLFGEHLLNLEPLKPVAIVESEKSAIIASIYLPQYIWLATGGLSHLTAERCKILNGREVKLYPDLGAFYKWEAKGKLLGFEISNILESKANEEERSQGLDIADFLLRSKIITSSNKEI